MPRLLRVSCTILCAAFFVSPAPSQSVAPSNQVAPAPTKSTTTNGGSMLPRGTADSSVRLGTGDIVELSVYDIPELSTKTRVSSAGDIYLPLIDYVHVAGLTLAEAQGVIEKRLDEGGFVKNPHVHLLLDEYISGGASILGEVIRPG